MKNLKMLVSVLICAAASVALTLSSAYAQQWQILGPRALGMGGAHVAVVNDSLAQYWNPAAFGFFGRQAHEEIESDEYSDKDAGLYIHGGIGYQTHEDILKEIEDVQDHGFSVLKSDILSSGLSDPANIPDYVSIISELDDLNKENIAITGLVNAGASFRRKNWGIGGLSGIDITAIPYIDTVNINPSSTGDMIADLAALPSNNSTYDSFTDATQRNNLIARIGALTGWDPNPGQNVEQYLLAVDDGLAATGESVTGDVIEDVYNTALIASQTSAGGTFDNNSSMVQFVGAAISEVPLTYGHAFGDHFALGMNVKAMKAKTYYTDVFLYDSDTEDIFDKAEDQSIESSSFGVDLGALYKRGILRLGIVGRNLNTPKFDWAGPGDFEIEPQVRAGLALRLWEWITLAADVDITENDTNISENYKSKNLGVGAEFDIMHFLRLRAGAYKNLSETDIGPVYTAGLGLNFAVFQLDAGASMSSDKATVDGEELPEEVRGEVALSFQF